MNVMNVGRTSIYRSYKPLSRQSWKFSASFNIRIYLTWTIPIRANINLKLSATAFCDQFKLANLKYTFELGEEGDAITARMRGTHIKFCYGIAVEGISLKYLKYTKKKNFCFLLFSFFLFFFFYDRIRYFSINISSILS